MLKKSMIGLVLLAFLFTFSSCNVNFLGWISDGVTSFDPDSLADRARTKWSESADALGDDGDTAKANELMDEALDLCNRALEKDAKHPEALRVKAGVILDKAMLPKSSFLSGFAEIALDLVDKYSGFSPDTSDYPALITELRDVLGRFPEGIFAKIDEATDLLAQIPDSGKVESDYVNKLLLRVMGILGQVAEFTESIASLLETVQTLEATQTSLQQKIAEIQDLDPVTESDQILTLTTEIQADIQNFAEAVESAMDDFSAIIVGIDKLDQRIAQLEVDVLASSNLGFSDTLSDALGEIRTQITSLKESVNLDALDPDALAALTDSADMLSTIFGFLDDDLTDLASQLADGTLDPANLDDELVAGITEDLGTTDLTAEDQEAAQDLLESFSGTGTSTTDFSSTEGTDALTSNLGGFMDSIPLDSGL